MRLLFNWLLKTALLAGWLSLSVNAAWSAVWKVLPGESISAMIRSAQPGDTVQVAHGFYAEQLMIDKPITLQGLDRPTISAQGTGHVIRVRSPDVRIQGFILRDSGVDLSAKNAGGPVKRASKTEGWAICPAWPRL